MQLSVGAFSGEEGTVESSALTDMIFECVFSVYLKKSKTWKERARNFCFEQTYVYFEAVVGFMSREADSCPAIRGSPHWPIERR